MRVGDVVHHVSEYDPPEGEMTWVVEVRTVSQIRRDGVVVLDRPLPGHSSRRVRPGAVHETRAAAIAAFVASQELEVKRATRRILLARRGLSWAGRETAEDADEAAGNIDDEDDIPLRSER